MPFGGQSMRNGLKGLLSIGIIGIWSVVQAQVTPKNLPINENFNRSQLTLWDQKGTVRVSGGSLFLGDPTNNTEDCWIFSKGEYTDFVVEVRARLVSNPKHWGGFGIWFRAPSAKGLVRDGGDGYSFGYVPGLSGLELVRWPMYFRLGPRVRIPIDQRWHIFRVVCQGPQIKAYFDGKEVFAVGAQHTVPLQLPSGRVGIGVWNRGSVQVDYIKIIPR
jgi:hypothetical protein